MAPKEKKPRFSENAVKVLEKRYLKKNENGEIVEDPSQMLLRVASSVARAEEK